MYHIISCLYHFFEPVSGIAEKDGIQYYFCKKDSPCFVTSSSSETSEGTSLYEKGAFRIFSISPEELSRISSEIEKIQTLNGYPKKHQGFFVFENLQIGKTQSSTSDVKIGSIVGTFVEDVNKSSFDNY